MAAALLAPLLAAGLGGCVERGDFGRVKRSAWNDIVQDTGSFAARVREEPVSISAFTDSEEEMRGRAWRFLVPAHDGAYLSRVLAELVATRVLPADMRRRDPTAYHQALVSEGGRSPASRYRRLSEDAAADARLLEPFARSANRVMAADRVRLAALDHASVVSPADVGNAYARVAENRCLIAWVQDALAFRLASYRYALEHLVIETPQTQAVGAERSLAMLTAARSVLDGFAVPPLAAAACLGEDLVAAPALARKG
jgi:hypothetical protein